MLVKVFIGIVILCGIEFIAVVVGDKLTDAVMKKYQL